jgi:hypothetical protein
LSIALSFSADSSAGLSITLSFLESHHIRGRALCSPVLFIVDEVLWYCGLLPLWVWIEPYALRSFVGPLPIEDLHRLVIMIVIDTISISIKPSSIALVPITGIEQLNKQQTTPSTYSALD